MILIDRNAATLFAFPPLLVKKLRGLEEWSPGPAVQLVFTDDGVL